MLFGKIGTRQITPLTSDNLGWGGWEVGCPLIRLNVNSEVWKVIQ